MLWHFYCSLINVFVLWLSGYEHIVAFLLFSYKRLCTVAFGIRFRLYCVKKKKNPVIKMIPLMGIEPGPSDSKSTCFFIP